MEIKPHLIVDIRNALYRAAYAYLMQGYQKPHNHPFIVLLKQFQTWMYTIKPSNIYIAWDAPRKTVWRRKILPTYKDRDNNDYVKNMHETLDSLTEICQDFFAHMNMRQMSVDKMEADDLIYACVDTLHPEPTVIVSTDSDMIQIPYKFNSCKVFDPCKQQCATIPGHNPVYFKAVVGDKSDKIDGYRGIGPKKGLKLITEHNKLYEYTTTQGRDLFIRNMLLIDLSLNPHLIHNKLYMNKVLSQPIDYNSSKLQELISKYKIAGLMSEYHNLIAPYSRLGK